MPGSRYGLGRRAFVDMFVFADSKARAEDTAVRYLNHSGWLKVVLIATFERQSPPPSWDKRWVKAYRQAEYYGVGVHVGVLPLAHQPGAQGGACP
jgi:hypothetical protein